MAASPGELALLSFSPVDMFMSAGPVIKIVMTVLMVACVASWTVLFAKTAQLLRVRRRLQEALLKVDEAPSLEAAQALWLKHDMTHAFVAGALDEWSRSSGALDDRDGLKERVLLLLERLEAAETRHLMYGTGLLATISATAPFIGLFGTVWGIMTSFAGITAAKSASLAAVAPGIAEALLATALGLVAAIPAVVIYNFLTRQCLTCTAQVADITASILRHVSRDLSRLTLSPITGGQILRFAATRSEQSVN